MGKKKRDPNEPQKPPSAYALFFKETQAPIKIQNPTATFGEVAKIVGSLWSSLDDEHKNQYKKKQELAKKEYLQALNKYKASLASAETGTSAENTEQEISDESHIEEPEEDSEETAACSTTSAKTSAAAPTTRTMKQNGPVGIRGAAPTETQGGINTVVKPGTAGSQDSDNITNGETVVNGVAEVDTANQDGDPSQDKDVPMTPPAAPICIRA
ncbi:unnamed protein product, partial [Meganyctiphanes norvegica]